MTQLDTCHLHMRRYQDDCISCDMAQGKIIRPLAEWSDDELGFITGTRGDSVTYKLVDEIRRLRKVERRLDERLVDLLRHEFQPNEDDDSDDPVCMADMPDADPEYTVECGERKEHHLHTR